MFPDDKIWCEGNAEPGEVAWNRAGKMLLEAFDEMRSALEEAATLAPTLESKPRAKIFREPAKSLKRRFPRQRPTAARSAASQKRASSLRVWQAATAQARLELDIKGFLPVKKGTELYSKVQEIASRLKEEGQGDK